jgi:DNA-binding transcriptional ArsR family regulator
MVQMKKIKKEFENEKALEKCAERFGLLGDLTKMKICYLLCHYPELSVSEIAQILNMPISRVSHALRKLKSAGIVGFRKEWRQYFYQIKNPNLSKLIKTLG